MEIKLINSVQTMAVKTPNFTQQITWYDSVRTTFHIQYFLRLQSIVQPTKYKLGCFIVSFLEGLES
jgi:hypothetical protein